jgi:hypothetical protein
MSNPHKLRIVCYLAWCGAEATYHFKDRESYEAAKAFLNTISRGHVEGDRLPAGYSAAADYYYLEVQDRDAFQDFMAGSSA